MRIPTAILALAAAALAGCGDPSSSGNGGAVDVVVTTGVVADLVQAVGGDRVKVATLIPAGADPHGYEPRPADLKALASARLIVSSGGEIDEWLDGAIDSAGASGAKRLTILDALDSGGAAPPADGGTEAGHGGDVDPHWWQDVSLAPKAVEAVEHQLAAVDPDGVTHFRAGARSTEARLKGLDTAIEACIAGIPRENRKLVTSHDAFTRYGLRYGLEVVGAVIPSRSTQARASSAAVARLIAQIRRERIPAIFPETSVHPKVEKTLAREAGAKVGRPLYADGLGPAGSPGATYLGALRSNTLAISEALGGARCDLP
jgi:zinc/manganese transport system substrate-binding protein